MISQLVHHLKHFAFFVFFQKRALEKLDTLKSILHVFFLTTLGITNMPTKELLMLDYIQQ